MKQVIVATLSAAILSIPPAAVAEEFGVGPHFGAGVVHVKSSDYCNTAGFSGSVFSCEDAEVGFKVFGGFRPVENFGAEAGFAWAEGFKISGRVNGVDFSGDTEYYTFYLAGVGVFPIGETFALTGKAGFHAWEQDSNISGGGSDFSFDADGTDPLFGVGAEFRPADNVVFQVEWLRLLGDDSDVDAISGNFALAF